MNEPALHAYDSGGKARAAPFVVMIGGRTVSSPGDPPIQCVRCGQLPEEYRGKIGHAGFDFDPNAQEPELRRRAIVCVTFDVLEEALGLPRGAIVDIEPPEWNFDTPREFRIKISTPDCPVAYEGMPIQEVELPIPPGKYHDVETAK